MINIFLCIQFGLSQNSYNLTSINVIGLVRVVKLLVRGGALINHADHSGKTALHYSAENGNL